MRRITIKPLRGKMDSLVSWKHEPDKFQDSDNVNIPSDQNSGWNEFGSSPSLTGSPKGVQFIMHDETNAATMRKMKMKRWF